MLQFTYKLKITDGVKEKCSRHPGKEVTFDRLPICPATIRLAISQEIWSLSCSPTFC